jgi:hypothetical protein
MAEKEKTAEKEKLFVQEFGVNRTDTFLIVAKNDKEAKEIFDDSVKEIIEGLEPEYYLEEYSDIKEITEPSEEDLKYLRGVILTKKEFTDNYNISTALRKKVEEVV